MEIERGPLVNLTPEQRTEFRNTGNLPKTEEAAPSSEPKLEKVEAKPAGDSETPESKQVHAERKPKPAKTADERIAELEATIEKIRKGSGKETPKVESSPTKPEPKPAADKEPTPEDVNEDGTPKFKTYEDYIRAQSRWEVRQELAEQKRKDSEAAQAKEFDANLEKAREKYENFDEKVTPFATKINKDPSVAPVIRQMFLDSEVLSDLLYTIGGSETESAKFLSLPPRKQMEFVILTEHLIREELDGAKTTVEEIPAKPRTQAPKPPSEAGGRAAAPPDGLEAAAKANDFRAFKAEATRRQLAKLKG
jgi:hypothetical protein